MRESGGGVVHLVRPRCATRGFRRVLLIVQLTEHGALLQLLVAQGTTRLARAVAALEHHRRGRLILELDHRASHCDPTGGQHGRAPLGTLLLGRHPHLRFVAGLPLRQIVLAVLRRGAREAIGLVREVEDEPPPVELLDVHRGDEHARVAPLAHATDECERAVEALDLHHLGDGPLHATQLELETAVPAVEEDLERVTGGGAGAGGERGACG